MPTSRRRRATNGTSSRTPVAFRYVSECSSFLLKCYYVIYCCSSYLAYVFQYFKRDADELEGWIYEKLQAASDESYKDPTNLQAKIQKHQAFEAEVAAHSNAIVLLDNTGSEMIAQHHFASDVIRKRLGIFTTNNYLFSRSLKYCQSMLLTFYVCIKCY